jgi:hypothetical protein
MDNPTRVKMAADVLYDHKSADFTVGALQAALEIAVSLLAESEQSRFADFMESFVAEHTSKTVDNCAD